MSKRLIESTVEALLALLLVSLSGGLASIAIGYLSQGMGSTPLWSVFHRGIYLPLMLSSLYLIRRGFGKWGLRDMGLNRGEGIKINLQYGVVAFSASALSYLPFLVALLPFYAGQLSPFVETMGRMSVPTIALLYVAYSPMILIDSPIPEEVVFRGYYQGMLTERFNSGVGILSSTLFFGLQHSLIHRDWHPGMVAATIPLGLILALTYQETRSLIPVITAHFLINFLMAYPMIFYAAGHTSIALLACLAIATASIAILASHRRMARKIFINETTPLKSLDVSSIILVIFFMALPLAFSFMAIMFRSRIV